MQFEDVASVLRRVGEVSPNQPIVTWTTVVDATDFATIDPDGGEIAEFTSGAPIWIVRRLIHDEVDGRQRLAIESIWTADGGTRVWRAPTGDYSPDLATSLDIHDLDANTTLVQVFDYDRVITSVGSASGLSGLDAPAARQRD